MWIRCNPNPLGKQTSDCVVRAIAIATEQSWKRTFRELCALGEIERNYRTVITCGDFI